MKKHVALLALAAFAHTGTWATIYTFTGPTYNSVTPYTAPCATGSCANFTTAMQQTGSFTINAPLAGNLNNANITSLITSYSFNDGLTQYTWDVATQQPNDKLVFAHITTDSAGNIVDENIVIQKWQTAAHNTNARLDSISVNSGSYKNLYCLTPAISSGTCSLGDVDPSTSYTFAHQGGGSAWTSTAAPANVAPTITSAVPPAGTVGTPYSFTVTATGTSPWPMAFTDAGTLPPGLTIDPTTGAITGTPTMANSFSVTLTANNGVMPSAAQTFQMNIAAAAAPGTGGVTAVPTLSEWALLLLSALLGALGLARGKREISTKT